MSFTICLSHDVDRVQKTYQYLTHDLRKGKFKNLLQIFNKQDPYWCFDKIIEIENKYSVKSTFFFLHESLKFKILKKSTWKLALGRYSLNDKKIIYVIQYLNKYGWEVGLHGSYNSYKSIDLLKYEKQKLEEIIQQKIIGIRQHYLNLNIPETWQLQKEVGFKYDASYGKKRGVGFIDEHNNPFIEKNNNMVVIPLTLMEANLMSTVNNNIDLALKIIRDLYDEAQKNNSTLVFLWHQRYFNEKEFPGYLKLYEEIIKEGKSRNAQFKKCIDIYSETVKNE